MTAGALLFWIFIAGPIAIVVVYWTGKGPMNGRARLAAIATSVAMSAGLLGSVAPASAAQTSQNVLVDQSGCAQGYASETRTSANGRWAVLIGDSCSPGSGSDQAFIVDLDPTAPDGNGYEEVSLTAGNSELLSVASVAVSDDGRYVAMLGDKGLNAYHVFLRDRTLHTLTLVSVDELGEPAPNGARSRIGISSDGSEVAFLTVDPLTSDDVSSDSEDIYVRNMVTGITKRVPIPPSLSSPPLFYGLSGDGQHVLFETFASLAADDTNEQSDVYVFDLVPGTFDLASRDANGQAFPNGGNDLPQGTNLISRDGNRVIFLRYDISVELYVRDRTAGTTTQVNVDAAAVTVPTFYATLDQSGRFVAGSTFGGAEGPFTMTDGTVITACDHNYETFLFDLTGGSVVVASRDAFVEPVSNPRCSEYVFEYTYATSVTSGGRYVFFQSDRTDLVGGSSPSWAAKLPLYRAWMGFTPSISGTVTADGGTVSSGSTTSSSDPISTTVVVPAGTSGGTVSITERGVVTELLPSGLTALDMEVEIHAPDATSENPLRFTFVLDGSLLAGVDPADVVLYRNGFFIPECVAVGVALDLETSSGGACIASKAIDATTHTITFVVLTPQASIYNAAVPDGTPPTVTITAPVGEADIVLGSSISATYSCADTGSGIASCNGAVGATPVPSGTALPAGAIGTYALSVTATDKAGNSVTGSVNYRVVYGWSGFSQPINDPAGSNQSDFKKGSTVPVKFTLTDANGVRLDDTTAQAVANNCAATITWARTTGTAGAVDETVNTDPASSGRCFRYDPAAHQFIYNLGTKDLQAKTNYTITATLPDGSHHAVTVGLR